MYNVGKWGIYVDRRVEKRSEKDLAFGPWLVTALGAAKRYARSCRGLGWYETGVEYGWSWCFDPIEVVGWELVDDSW
jgi:hypothetical protein